MRLRRKRRFFTAAESAEIWDRWRKGEGLKSIGRVFGKTSSSIFAHLSPTGGIRPPPRRRSRLALTLAEREEISRGLVHGHSLRRIACSLGRAPSTEAGRSCATGARVRTAPRPRIGELGIELGARRRVSSRGIPSCGESWPCF